LSDDAEQWSEADEEAKLSRDLRCRIFGRRRQMYRILYTIKGDAIRVHAVRHAAQDELTQDDLD